MARSPFPLQWPDGWKRAEYRRTPKFGTCFTEDRDAVIRYLRKRGGSNIVITSNLPVNTKGLPYEAGVIGGGGDTGVAVWWVERGKEQVIACDAWVRAAQNLSAIERTLTALRALDRHGCSSVVEKAFAGFAALPGAGETSDGAPPPPKPREWHEVLELTDLWSAGIASADLLILAKARHREKIKLAHPVRARTCPRSSTRPRGNARKSSSAGIARAACVARSASTCSRRSRRAASAARG
jgi:hypothetical protein